ncbi:MAG: serine protease [Patescibacteria group bacterium]|nr:serine protease [Patescibacteria group bacterium]
MTTHRKILFLLLAFALLFPSACRVDNGSAKAATQEPSAPKSEQPRVGHNLLAVHELYFPISKDHGSGVVLTKDGWVLTAWHVVKDEKSSPCLIEGTAEGKVNGHIGRVMFTERLHDLALIKFDARFANTAVVGDDRALFPGDSVYQIGFPYSFSKTVLMGFVASLDWAEKPDKNDKTPNYDPLLVEISSGPGSSGGGLFSGRDGRLIGISEAYYPRPSMIPWGFVHIRFIRAFLDRHHIDYRTTFEESE